MDHCHKHGPYSVFCRMCDVEALQEEEQRQEADREERRQEEEREMERHYRDHPHG